MEQIVHFTENTTAWRVIASDGSSYASLAALYTAGKKPFPYMQPACNPMSLEVSSDNGSGAAGSGFYFNRNQGAAFAALSTDAARDAISDLNYGAGQKEVLPGQDPRLGHFVPTFNVWIRKIAGGDKTILKATF